MFFQDSIYWLAENIWNTGWNGGATILKVSDVIVDKYLLDVLLFILHQYITAVSQIPVLSSSLLYEDSDSGLFSVTLFMKAIDDFKHKARENK